MDMHVCTVYMYVCIYGWADGWRVWSCLKVEHRDKLKIQSHAFSNDDSSLPPMQIIIIIIIIIVH